MATFVSIPSFHGCSLRKDQRWTHTRPARDREIHNTITWNLSMPSTQNKCSQHMQFWRNAMTMGELLLLAIDKCIVGGAWERGCEWVAMQHAWSLQYISFLPTNYLVVYSFNTSYASYLGAIAAINNLILASRLLATSISWWVWLTKLDTDTYGWLLHFTLAANDKAIPRNWKPASYLSWI